MRRVRNRSLSGAYETLSDIAMGSLGVFIVLVVVIVIISTFSYSEDSSPYKSIVDANALYESQSKKIKQDFREYKLLDSANVEIEKLKNDFEDSKRKLSTKLEELNEEEKSLEASKNKFDEVQSVLNVINQTKKEKAQFLIETKKLNAQLESLIDKQTGYGVDRTGRPNLFYSTYTADYFAEKKDSLYLIGNEGVLTQNQFYSLLKSIKHEGESSFFIRYKSGISKYTHDRIEPTWSEDLWKKAGWVTTSDVKKKDGY